MGVINYDFFCISFHSLRSKHSPQGKRPIYMGQVWCWRIPNLHHLRTVSVHCGTTFTRDWSFRIKVSALLPLFTNPLNYFALLCAVLEHVKWSNNRLKQCVNGLKCCCKGENSGSVKSVGLRPIPYTYDIFLVVDSCVWTAACPLTDCFYQVFHTKRHQKWTQMAWNPNILWGAGRLHAV